MKNAAQSNSSRFFFDVRAAPLRSPIGRIPTSTPSRKIARPKITSIPPKMNLTSVGLPNGAIVRLRSVTMNIIGTTEKIVSFSFK